MGHVFIVLGVYYEEGEYQVETILKISNTMIGAVNSLKYYLESMSHYEYEEYLIKKYSVES